MTRKTDKRRPSARVRVLVVAAEPMIAALLGLLLDPAEYEAVFPLPGEAPEEALARMRPRVVVVLDTDLEAARSDLFFARSQRHQATVVLFSAPTSAHDATAMAAARGIPAVRLPMDREALSRVLQAAVQQAMASGFWSMAVAAGLYAVALAGAGAFGTA